MIGGALRSIFGSSNKRNLKRYQKRVARINQLEARTAALDGASLQAKTGEFKQRLDNGAPLDDLLAEAFAVCREAGKRVLGMRHFDVQLIGGMVLHEGKIAEMGTGEGKTLVATLPVYLNALSGKGVHVVTVNDYLAKRDSEWMGRLYQFLGLSVGVILSGQYQKDKVGPYAADITYGTNNEFGFDYLRDNMAFSSHSQMQRSHHFAIVDEVDSILIDEARTPLIISGPAEENVAVYEQLNDIPEQLKKQVGEVDKDGIPSPDYQPGDYILDEKNRSVTLTDQGHEKVEQFLYKRKLLPQNASLYDARNIAMMQHINSAVRAHTLYRRDTDYLVENNEIVIIDEFTGRKMRGRRWSDGLHQAIEAKEKVAVQNENQTLASITFQNYFRLYDKLSGMTGTADTEAVEFQQIYKLSVVVIPPNKPIRRTDHADVVYLTRAEKYTALVDHIREVNERGQPILLGTASISSSEHISGLLKRVDIRHQVLNAKQHEREAHIISQAGQVGAVTIATNMAGRGTDIVLGGNIEFELNETEDSTPEERSILRDKWQENHRKVIESGGLHVVATERHESRRVDNQLRGRSGRQGDPGSSVFFLSLEDDLMRIFASNRMRSMMEKLGMRDGESIEHPWVTKAIANAQKKVEGRNFEVRKQLLEYDNVVNEQRKVVYKQRNDVMSKGDISAYITRLRSEDVYMATAACIHPNSPSELWDIEALEGLLREEYNIRLPVQKWLDEDELLNEEGVKERILNAVEEQYRQKEEVVGAESIRHFEKAVLLQTLDVLWKEHLSSLDYLRQGIHLRGYAQRNPVQEYKKEAFAMFSEMLDRLRHDVTKILCFVELHDQAGAEELQQAREADERQLQFQHSTSSPPQPDLAKGTTLPYRREMPKVGRNDPCPCGSGKKYKRCHGRA